MKHQEVTEKAEKKIKDFHFYCLDGEMLTEMQNLLERVANLVADVGEMENNNKKESWETIVASSAAYMQLIVDCIAYKRIEKNRWKKTPVAIEEEGYKNGYRHGFYAAKNSDATMEEVERWSRTIEFIGPPGSAMAGHCFGKFERYERKSELKE